MDDTPYPLSEQDRRILDDLRRQIEPPIDDQPATPLWAFGTLVLMAGIGAVLIVILS